MTEGRNTEFKKILDALEANGSPMPEFETDNERSYFITRLFVYERFKDISIGEPKRSRKKTRKPTKKCNAYPKKCDAYPKYCKELLNAR
ncbi:MAG: hypothetical protein NC419_11890 [Muribaculaceae bacterium]|nr:hypothetical protein [Muribaculaceae bacterium]